MRPFIFHIGSMGVPAFFFSIMVGSLVGTFYAAHIAKKEGSDPVVMLDFGILSIISSVIGSRLFHVVVENPMYYWEHPIRVFYFWQGGFVSIGAFMLSVMSCLIYLRWRKLPIFKNFDIVTMGVPFAIFFVRTGCLCAGCCYGKPTDFFVHLVFNNPGSTAGHFYPGVPLHATQIYSMLNAVVMFFVLHWVRKRKRFDGQLLATFLMYYGVTRFFIEEPLRGDVDRGVYFNGLISTGQISMAVFFAVGMAIWLIQKRRLSS